ncbi:MAG: sigma-70 family RNA polymerase sigma factor [Acidobacteriota bacterium]|nr:sigma-70 family RNA polymerase sigma factor [Acidobacteriota bacterium]
MELSDELAIGRARRGDRDAYRVLVERHSRAVFRLAYRMTGNEIDAEDIVQDTFLKAWKQIGKFDGRASFPTWLHRICANCSLDLIRARKRRQDLYQRAEAGGDIKDTPDPFSRIPAETPSPERLAQSSQVAAALLPALNQLSEMERTAFVMRHYDGMGIEEISQALGVQPGAAKHSVFRAVQKLRRALEPVMSAGK